MENRVEQNVWNIGFTVFYAVLLLVMMVVLFRLEGSLPTAISFFDVALIVLATFRLIRLFVYDKVMRWFRDLFASAKRGPAKTLSDLLGCPWCLGLWMGTFVVFFYFLLPDIAWFIILILAVSSLASVFQLLANLIGWSAERGKLAAQKMERE